MRNTAEAGLSSSLHRPFRRSSSALDKRTSTLFVRGSLPLRLYAIYQRPFDVFVWRKSAAERDLRRFERKTASRTTAWYPTPPRIAAPNSCFCRILPQALNLQAFAAIQYVERSLIVGRRRDDRVAKVDPVPDDCVAAPPCTQGLDFGSHGPKHSS